MDKEELKQKLTAEEYHVTQEGGTEAPFSGKYVHHHKDGTYACKVCGTELFSSNTKFDSKTGWPSFTNPKTQKAVELKEDTSHGMVRTEVVCKNCGAHLGHVFPDGPKPTGERYCINSCALDFKKE